MCGRFLLVYEVLGKGHVTGDNGMTDSAVAWQKVITCPSKCAQSQICF